MMGAATGATAGAGAGTVTTMGSGGVTTSGRLQAANAKAAMVGASKLEYFMIFLSRHMAGSANPARHRPMIPAASCAPGLRMKARSIQSWAHGDGAAVGSG
jgi:hypothetical protein